MSDLPSYDFDSKENDGEMKLKKENASQIKNFINGMI